MPEVCEFWIILSSKCLTDAGLEHFFLLFFIQFYAAMLMDLVISLPAKSLNHTGNTEKVSVLCENSVIPEINTVPIKTYFLQD